MKPIIQSAEKQPEMLNPAVGRLIIDLGAIKKNYNILKTHANSGCEIAAVIKANAYGLGAEQVASTLKDEGCKNFYVSVPQEGMHLRQYVGNAAIYILNGFYPRYQEQYLHYNLTPVIGSFREIETYTNLGKQNNQKLPVAINFNTGINRLGFGVQDTEKLLQNLHLLNGIDVKVILSHFASADEPDAAINQKQFETFNNIAKHFPRAMKSLANSFGFLLDKKYHFDMARPGMALYGLNPVPYKKNIMTPVVRLDVPVIRLRNIKAGEGIGYNTIHTFDKDSQIAVVSAGYADGILRSLSNKGAFYWKNHRCPIRGRISMDLITVDITAIPEKDRPQAGDFLEVLGNNQTADDLAKDADTIGYEILTSLGNRYEREYIN